MMTERQLEIYKGLRSIGTEIAAFYHDGVILSEMNLDTKPYLLAHLSREIESGLRDVLTPKSLTNEEICEKCSRPLNRKIGHKKSIIHSLGLDSETDFVKQWYKVAKQFPGYAHRHGVWKNPREQEEFDDLWHQFEDVLAYLVGNYYAIADRLDGILKMEEPSEEVLNALPNLLKEESRFFYFFNKLKHRQWLPFLEERGYFDGSKNPEPVESEDNPGFYSTPYWGVLSYLEEVAKQNLNSPEKEITESLVRIVDSICQYRNPHGNRIENYRTDYTILKIICTLPEEYLEDRHFDYIKAGLQNRWNGLIGYGYDEFLDRLINIGNKHWLLKAVQLLLTHKIVDGTFEKVQSIFEPYELQKLLSDYKDKLISVLRLELLNLGIEKINEVFQLDETTFNIIRIPAIENHEQTSFPDKYECQLVYLVRDTLEALESNEVRKILKELLANEHPIFKRIAIHTIRVRYAEFKELFWKSGNNPLCYPKAKHEVYELLKEHSADFTVKEIDQVIDWVNSKEYYSAEEYKDDKDKVEKSIAYQKKEWLMSLLPSGAKKVTELIEALNKINDAEVKHPGFDSWHSSLTGNVSPLTMGEILDQSIEETITYFHDFSKQHHDFMGPSVDGLIDMLTLTVRNNPEKYIVDCLAIVNAPSRIKYAWIKGLEESWGEEKKEFDCEEVFDAIQQIIHKKEFWESHNTDDNYGRWFISNLLSFIEAGLRDDNHAFDPKQLPVIKQILFNILENDRYPVSDYSNLPMTVLNNSRGKIYMTLFEYSLRLARLEGKDRDRWDSEIKELITKKINLQEDNPLLFFVIGQFLPNIHYLDETWLIQNFNKLFPLHSKINWSASVSGYFLNNRGPNRTLFRLFTEGSHLEEALSSDLIAGESKKGLVQKICIAYLYDFESFEIDKEIIQTLVYSDSKSVLSNLIFFFWDPNSLMEKKLIHKIKPLWIELFKRAIKIKNEELDTFILSGCCKWLNSIEEIDDELYDILLGSAPYITQRDRSFVIESLAKHINDYPEKVGNILIAIFNKKVYYDLSEGKLQEMVENLYSKGFKEIADKICIIHGEQGYHFLRDLYKKYNA